MRFLLLSILGLFLVGCSTLSGRVSAASYTEPPQQPLFSVVSPDALSLSERTIAELIEKKMTEHGFDLASPPESANVAVYYRYSFGPSRVSSHPDYVFGGQKVSTSHSRTFEVMVMDIEKSKALGKVVIIWQGELYSSGSSTDMAELAPDFIDALFEQYGKTVKNESFMKLDCILFFCW